ncbi:dipeptidase PepE [Ascidiimonas sp. W6]|uniref:dipeptidase PepE n=1 Tax=Ascidiimonas meishanensis TaxID=3128903 RepID=UPI0030ECFEC0
MKTMILASTSTIYGSSYLEYLLESLEILYQNSNEIVFIPFARPSGITFEEYTGIVSKAFKRLGKNVKGITKLENTQKQINDAEGIFVGGGNTFLLVNTLYQTNSMGLLRNRVVNGIPYLGTSAGSNIAGLTMKTTNDMPIIHPPSFKTMGLIPFNINAHYIDPEPNSKHMGETRETRIKEFHQFNTPPVLGLREGSWLEIKKDKITLRGNLSARVFEKDKLPYEIATNQPVIIK